MAHRTQKPGRARAPVPRAPPASDLPQTVASAEVGEGGRGRNWRACEPPHLSSAPEGNPPTREPQEAPGAGQLVQLRGAPCPAHLRPEVAANLPSRSEHGGGQEEARGRSRMCCPGHREAGGQRIGTKAGLMGNQ